MSRTPQYNLKTQPIWVQTMVEKLQEIIADQDATIYDLENKLDYADQDIEWMKAALAAESEDASANHD